MTLQNASHSKPQRKIIIIGSGFSSLSAACYLAKDGYEVTVFERNDTLGGRPGNL